MENSSYKISHGKVTHSMATIVNNTIYIAYLKVAKRGDFKNPHPRGGLG